MNVNDTVNEIKTHHNGHTTANSLMPSMNEEVFREPLILGNPSLHDITEKIASIPTLTPNLKFLITLFIFASMAAWGIFAMGYTIATGIGVWGLNNPVGWGWDITNFVFWIETCALPISLHQHVEAGQGAPVVALRVGIPRAGQRRAKGRIFRRPGVQIDHCLSAFGLQTAQDSIGQRLAKRGQLAPVRTFPARGHGGGGGVCQASHVQAPSRSTSPAPGRSPNGSPRTAPLPCVLGFLGRGVVDATSSATRSSCGREVPSLACQVETLRLPANATDAPALSWSRRATASSLKQITLQNTRPSSPWGTDTLARAKALPVLPVRSCGLETSSPEMSARIM